MINKKILNHFKTADPTLYKVFIKYGQLQELPNRRGTNHFLDLIDAILSQQLSGKVSEIIFARFKDLFQHGKITPGVVLKVKDDKLRNIGISYQKIKYIKDLAGKIENKELNLNSLKSIKDENVILELIRVKGIGRWTAEMFLIFTLKREDVFSHGDLGLKNAILKIYNLKEYSQSKVEKIVSRWSPYKSYASKILWKSLDNR